MSYNGVYVLKYSRYLPSGARFACPGVLSPSAPFGPISRLLIPTEQARVAVNSGGSE